MALAPSASVATTLTSPTPFQSWAGVIETILFVTAKDKFGSVVKEQYVRVHHPHRWLGW